MIDSRAIFGFLRIQEPPTRPTDPSDKKEGHEIDSLSGVLDPKIRKLYGTLGRLFRSASINYPRWFLFFVDFGLKIRDFGVDLGEITF